MTSMTPDQLRELYGSPADTWPEQGLTVMESDGRANVFKDEVLVGWVENQEFPHLKRHLPTFSTVITLFENGEPWGVAFPGGFMPPDPMKARRSEQIRWLPAGHPDRPNGTPAG